MIWYCWICILHISISRAGSWDRWTSLGRFSTFYQSNNPRIQAGCRPTATAKQALFSLSDLRLTVDSGGAFLPREALLVPSFNVLYSAMLLDPPSQLVSYLLMHGALHLHLALVELAGSKHTLQMLISLVVQGTSVVWSTVLFSKIWP